MTTLTLENADELLIQRLSAAIAKAADDGMVKISKGLFRYAVLEEMILHILASQSGITSDVVGKLRARAIKNVRKTRGRVSLEAIADFQNGQDKAIRWRTPARLRSGWRSCCSFTWKKRRG